MLYDRTLQAGSQIFSLNPDRGPHDSGIIPQDYTVSVGNIDYGERGSYLHGRVNGIIRDVAVHQVTMGERAFADLGPAVEVYHERLNVAEVDCGGMDVWVGRTVYFRR